MTIKVLKKQGKSIKGIARETGLARNTVKKYLQQAQAIPNARKPSVRPSKLDPFKPYLTGLGLLAFLNANCSAK